MSEPRFFVGSEEFAAWLAANHAASTEILVGFHKRATGRPSLSWEESVEQALRFGWIDGIRRSLGSERGRLGACRGTARTSRAG